MGTFRIIQIIGGDTMISPEDYELVMQYEWAVDKHGYAVCFNPPMKMHHLINGKPPAGMVTDHKNRVRLDNRRENLRFLSHKDSCANKGAPDIKDEDTYFTDEQLRKPSAYDRKAVTYARDRLGRFIKGLRRVQV